MTFSGVYYCTEHNGICNEDSDVCDFTHRHDDSCVLHPLYYDVNEVRDDG